MKIAMAIQNFYPVVGGAERQAMALSKILVSRGHSVTVLTTGKAGLPSLEKINGVVVRRFFRSPFLFSVRLFLHLVYNRSAYDVIHAHLAASHAAAAAIAGRLLGKPVIVKMGGKDGLAVDPSRVRRLTRLKMAALARFRPTLVFVNSFQPSHLSFPLTGRSAMIPNGVDLDWFHSPSENEKSAARRRFGWSGFIFLYVGRFHADKIRPDVFSGILQALKNVMQRHPEAKLVLVGEGPLEGDYRKRIADHGLESSVSLLPSVEDIRPYYYGADAFLLASLREGLSNALLEALACGLPVVGADREGISNVITDGKDGFLFNPEDHGEIRRVLEAAVDAVQSRSDICGVCVDKARQYSLASVAEKYEELYRGN